MAKPRLCPQCDVVLPDDYPYWKTKCKSCWKHAQPYIHKSMQRTKNLLWKYRGNQNEWKRRTLMVDEPIDNGTMPTIPSTSENPRSYVDFGFGYVVGPAKGFSDSSGNRRQLRATHEGHEHDSDRKTRLGSTNMKYQGQPCCLNCKSPKVKKFIRPNGTWFRRCLLCNWKSEEFTKNNEVD